MARTETLTALRAALDTLATEPRLPIDGTQVVQVEATAGESSIDIHGCSGDELEQVLRTWGSAEVHRGEFDEARWVEVALDSVTVTLFRA